jgi:hypothetical protein
VDGFLKWFLISFYLLLQKKCDLKHPPGDEIYRSGTLSMFEVSFVSILVSSISIFYSDILNLDPVGFIDIMLIGYQIFTSATFEQEQRF